MASRIVDLRLLRQLNSIGEKDGGTAFPIVFFGVATIVFTFITGRVYGQISDDDMLGQGIDSRNLVVTLYVMGSLDILLLFVMALRGMWLTKTAVDLFSRDSIQSVIVIHALFPAIVKTALWAARIMITALVVTTVDGLGDLAHINSQNSLIKASFIHQTLSTVFGVWYAAVTLSVVTVNTNAALALGGPQDRY